MGELINTKLSFIRCEKKKLAKKVRNQNKFDSMSEHYGGSIADKIYPKDDKLSISIQKVRISKPCHTMGSMKRS